MLGRRGRPAPLRQPGDLRRARRARCSRARRAGRRRSPARSSRRARRERGRPAARGCEFVVFDLETTGLSPARDRICEIGAVRVRGLEVVDSFQSLVAPGRRRCPRRSARLTGLRRAAAASRAARRVGRCGGFSAFAGDALLVAHNARFDQRFLERTCSRSDGRRLSEPPICTAALARRLLEGRGRSGRASPRSRTSSACRPRPATARCPTRRRRREVFVRLIGLRQELGARRSPSCEELAAPRKRRVYGKRALARGAPARPGVYLFHDRHGQVLYVGQARDLRARLRSYFRSERQRPSVEAALLALDRIEWRVLGSELEAALEEVRLIRELEPPANSRSRRRERDVYLRRRGRGLRRLEAAGRRSGRSAAAGAAALAARALASAHAGGVRRPARGRRRSRACAPARRPRRLPALRGRGAAARPHRGAGARVDRLARLDRLRRAASVRARAGARAGLAHGFFVAGGLVRAVRPLPPGAGALVELEAGLACCPAEADDEPLTAEHAEELLLVGGFVRRPPPELARAAARPRPDRGAPEGRGPGRTDRTVSCN